MNRLPQTVKRSERAKLRQQYEKRVSGHHVQIDVKFLNFKDQSGKKVWRYQHTVLDARHARIRALQMYQRHN